MDAFCDILETYKGRDKVLCTLCYSTKLVGGLSRNELRKERFNAFSSQMSKARAILRLLDDLPMLKYTLDYGLGRQEPDTFMSTLGVATNCIDQLYYPIEKMAWLAEHKLITEQNFPWDTASSVCWVLSIYLTLMKSLRYVNVLHKHKRCLKTSDTREQLSILLGRQQYEILTCIRLSLDLVHAINTLPSGILWSSKLKPWHVGTIGTISSLLGMYQLFTKKRLK